MTDLATVPRPADVALPAVTGGNLQGALQLMRDHVETLNLVEKFVGSIVDTPFLPEAHWPLPVGVRANEMPNRSARMMHGRETHDDWQVRRQIACASGVGAVLTGLPLGLDPLTSLAQIYIVKGRPGMYAKLKVALAQSRGHKVWDEEYTDEAVTVAGQRRGEDDVVRIRITMEQARTAKWTENETYEKTPRDMLWARAASRVVDRIAGDVLFGLPSIEDLEDAPEPSDRDRPAMVTATIPDAAGAPTAGSSSDTLRAALGAAATVRGHVDDAKAAMGTLREQVDAVAAEQDEVETPAVEQPIDEAQWRKINARFVDLGVTGVGRDRNRLAVISHIVERPVTRGSELTAAEAAYVLDNLAGVAGAGIVGEVLGIGPHGDEPAAATQAADAVLDAVEDEAGEGQFDDEAAQDAVEGRPAALDGTPDPWGINP